MGGSDKTLYIYDLARESFVRSIAQAHDKVVQRIHLNEWMTSIEHSPDTQNMFLTSSVDGCIKLWDLRAERYSGLGPIFFSLFSDSAVQLSSPPQVLD